MFNLVLIVYPFKDITPRIMIKYGNFSCNSFYQFLFYLGNLFTVDSAKTSGLFLFLFMYLCKFTYSNRNSVFEVDN